MTDPAVSADAPAADDTGLLHSIEELGETLMEVRRQVGVRIFGQQAVVDEALITLLSSGHALLVGVPGLAKTRLTETLGAVLGLSEKRIQFTPDLMPEHRTQIGRAHV